MCESSTIHKFEAAGCGIAPFRIVNVEIRTGPIKSVVDFGNGPVEVEVGSPGQPMGCCDYCGQGIAECWIIQDANGKRFMVGSSCVAKTGDAGLKKQQAPHKTKLRHARDDARIAAAEKLFEREAVRALLATRPHANEYRASLGDSLADSVEWSLAHAGRAGKIKAARVIESAAKHLKATGRDS